MPPPALGVQDASVARSRCHAVRRPEVLFKFRQQPLGVRHALSIGERSEPARMHQGLDDAGTARGHTFSRADLGHDRRAGQSETGEQRHSGSSV